MSVTILVDKTVFGYALVVLVLNLSVDFARNLVGITSPIGGEMLNLGSSSHLFLLPGAIDMWKAINGLAQMVADHTAHNVLGGVFFIF